MSAVHSTNGGANAWGFQSRVNDAMDVLRTFRSAPNGVERYERPMMRNKTESVVLWFVMWLCDPSLSCPQSTCHQRQWCNEVGVIDPVGPPFPPASSDDRSASQLLGFVHHVDQFL
ncbi:hypothetical protein TNCV_587001 [Trichonephila clavipes]|nr:hypothetical protein TNCV_587001 [Trichonephila clavipes]